MLGLLVAALLLGAAASPGCISSTCSACLLSSPRCGWCDAAGSKQCLEGWSRASLLFFFFFFLCLCAHSVSFTALQAHLLVPPRARALGFGTSVQVRPTCSADVPSVRRKKNSSSRAAPQCLRRVPRLPRARAATTCRTAAGAAPRAPVWRALLPAPARPCARPGSLPPVPARPRRRPPLSMRRSLR